MAATNLELIWQSVQEDASIWWNGRQYGCKKAGWFHRWAWGADDIPGWFPERSAAVEAVRNHARRPYQPLYDRIEAGARPCFVRFGRPPADGRSRDFRENRLEPGVAVYSGWIDSEGIIIDLRSCDQASALFIVGCDDCYLCEGEVVGRTSDGTPAIRLTSSKRVDLPIERLAQ